MKTHRAKSGQHAGQMVECRARLHCTLAPSSEHEFFADAASVESYNEIDTAAREVESIPWQVRNGIGDDAEELGALMDKAEGARRLAADTTRTTPATFTDSSRNDAARLRAITDGIWGESQAGEGLGSSSSSAPSTLTLPEGSVIIGEGWRQTSDSETEGKGSAYGHADSRDMAFGNGESLVVIRDSHGYDNDWGEFSDRRVEVRSRHEPNVSISGKFDKSEGGDMFAATKDKRSIIDVAAAGEAVKRMEALPNMMAKDGAPAKVEYDDSRHTWKVSYPTLGGGEKNAHDRMFGAQYKTHGIEATNPDAELTDVRTAFPQAAHIFDEVEASFRKAAPGTGLKRSLKRGLTA